MDRALYSIRPYTESDLEAEVRIDTAVDPLHPHTLEELRHWIETATTGVGHVSLRFAAADRRTGAVVAYGVVQHTSFNFHPLKFELYVAVHPDFQGQGIGRELYAALENEVLQRSAICLWSMVRENEPRAVRFMEQSGFVPRRKAWRSRLDVARADLSKFPDRTRPMADRGIVLTTLAEEGRERPEVRQRAFRLCTAASADVPRMGEYSPVSFEEFVEFDLNGPGALPDAYFLARRGDEYVGSTVMDRDLAEPDTLQVGFTGTHPGFRGLGIASELKRRAVEYARTRGYRFLLTNNDSLNHPIWAINERLGFRPETTWIQGEKELVPRTPTSVPSGRSPGEGHSRPQKDPQG
ncbi:MAG: GNAT family N-acetyltransferase [Thermoplasmata archaeon]|nr:GNAT family N-acetyltransferase [Thermoplasmata archaeon]